MSVAFRFHRGHAFCLAGLAAICAIALTATDAHAAPPPPQEDPFYTYAGSTPLASIAPGTDLKTRTELFHVVGVPLPVKAVQILYRTINALGEPAVNVTSVLEPLLGPAQFAPVISYQPFYDSLNPEADPSYAISGGEFKPGEIVEAEQTLMLAPALLAGVPVVIPDAEGENADFAVGPEEGANTLNSLRAALSSTETGLGRLLGLEYDHKIGLAGYSGGAIATQWAAELAPAYAPEINEMIAGATFGGTLVDPAHNLRYVEGTSKAVAIPIALIGIARGYHINLLPYLSEEGLEIVNSLQHATLVQAAEKVTAKLTWSQLFKPQYPTLESIPALAEAMNRLIMGSDGTPSAPLFITQGAGGEKEGIPGDKPGIGPGDGIMIAGDVRSLAREYCSRGVTVKYDEYAPLDHLEAFKEKWAPHSYEWLIVRLSGFAPPTTCGEIAPGNSLEPVLP
jgi:Secretory lipase